MNTNQQTYHCPFCGGTEFIEGYQSGYGAIYGKGMIVGASLKHIICRSCGSVVRSYVDDPEKLLPRGQRKNKN